MRSSDAPATSPTSASRADAFVRWGQALGLSPAQVVFLAQVRACTERQSIIVESSGRRTLAAVGEDGLWRMNQAARRVQGPGDVAQLKAHLTEIWAHDQRGQLPKENARTLMEFIHGPGLLRQLDALEQGPWPDVVDWPAAQAQVERSMRPPTGLPQRPSHLSERLGRHALRHALSQAGFQGVSWNSWWHPAGSEWGIAQRVQALAQYVQTQVPWGLRSPGLASAMHLSLDEDEQATSMFLQRGVKPAALPGLKGTPLAGNYRCALPASASLEQWGAAWRKAANALLHWKNPSVSECPEGPLSSSPVQEWLRSPTAQKTWEGLDAPPSLLGALSERRASVGLPAPTQVDPAVFKAKAPR